MRNLNAVFEDCIAMMDDIEMDYGTIVEVTVNTRAKGRWGQCRHRYVGVDVRGEARYVNHINISSILLDERIPLKSLQTVIIHEILHTCPGCQNHGYEWKRRAAKVKRELGYDIKTKDSNEDLKVDDVINKEYVKPKYIIRCTGCGKEIGKQRMCEMVKFPQRYIHKTCGGKLERIV